MTRRGAIFIGAVLLLSGGAVLVYLGGSKPPPPAENPTKKGIATPQKQTPEPNREKPAVDSAKSFEDTAEDRVAELEASLQGLARQLRHQACEGAVPFFSPDFKGTPLLAAPPPSAVAKNVGSTSVVTWQGREEDNGDANGIAPSLRTFVKPLAQVTYAVFKLPKCDGDDVKLEGVLAVDIDGVEPSGALVHAKESYEAIFTRPAGGEPWRIARLSRTWGRRLRNERALFADVTESLGLRMPETRYNEDLPTFMEPYSFLGGIAVGDYDGDGYLDIFLPAIGRTFMFHNEGGVFKEMASQTGTLYNDAGASAIFLDYDNCGRLDLLIANFEPEIVPSLKRQSYVKNETGRALTLLRNRGDGTFEDVTKKAGLVTYGPATSVVAADVNRDGYLDIYVCMYKDFQGDATADFIPIPKNVMNATKPYANQLWVNQGDGTFKEEAEKRGVADKGWSFAAAFGDYDNDGWPDLYVVNDYGPHHLYHNKGNGYFEDVTEKAGVSDLGFGMGAAWGDYEGSGRLSLYVSNMYSTAGNRVLARGPANLTKEQHEALLKMARGNTLLRNKGDGRFEDVTAKAGVGKAGWAWGTAFFDYELNGKPGIYVANGYITGETDADL